MNWLDKWEADMGMQSMLIGIAMMIMGYFLGVYVIGCHEIRMIRDVLHSGLKITNLAAAVSDEEEIGKLNRLDYYYDEETGTYRYEELMEQEGILILKPSDTYAQYKELWQQNIEQSLLRLLGDQEVHRIKDLKIEEFILYNVEDAEVTCYRYAGVSNAPSSIQSKSTSGAKLYAPDGSQVLDTSIYSRMGFSYQDMFGRWHNHLCIEQYSAVREAN